MKFSPLKKFAIRHIVGMLALLFFIGIILIAWYLNQLSENQVHSTAVKNAQILSATLTRFRQLYTDEVVPKALSHGLKLSHNYKSDDDSIPLPAALSLLLGSQLTKNKESIKSMLYSPYPFPWSSDKGGLNDQFAKDAWEAFQQDPSKPFVRFEQYENRNSLRYATADVMREACVKCHNEHADTPKSDWKVGDVRGIIEIVAPVDSSFALVDDMLKQTLFLMGAMAVLTLFTIAIVVSQLRALTKKAEKQTSKTLKTNHQLEREVKNRKKAELELIEMSYIDGLLGIANRRRFDEVYQKEWSRALRNKTSIAVILLDIDYFKDFNDNYGHQAGDNALIEVAQLISEQLGRSLDLVARYGGEEFIVLLPDTDLRGATEMTQKILKAIEGAKIPHQFSTVSPVLTLSGGVSACIPMLQVARDRLIFAADTALYQAKENGRNQLSLAKE